MKKKINKALSPRIIVFLVMIAIIIPLIVGCGLYDHWFNSEIFGGNKGHSPDIWEQDGDMIKMYCSDCKQLVAEKKASKGLYYQLNSDAQSYSVLSIYDCKDTEIVIPLTHEGLPVTRIVELAPKSEYDYFKQTYVYEKSYVKRIYLSPNIEYVGRIYQCDKLEYIYFSKNVKEIKFNNLKGNLDWSKMLIEISSQNEYYELKNGVVYGNDGKDLILCLPISQKKSFTIPSGVTTVTYRAFRGCESLENIKIPASVTNVEHEVFDYCTSLKKIVIGSGVESFNSFSFLDCSSLENIEINSNNHNYTSIDGNAYSKDHKTMMRYAPGKKNESFTVPSGVETIGRICFVGSENLSTVVISEGVKTINALAFDGCESIKEIFLPGSIEKIEKSAFDDTHIERVNIPSFKDWFEIELEFPEKSASPLGGGGNLCINGQALPQSFCFDRSIASKVPESAFEGCGAITQLVVSNVSSIGQSAFSYCESLKSVKIVGVPHIGGHAFAVCESLTDVKFDDSVKSIGSYGFSFCTSLKTFEFPVNVEKISDSVLRNCTSLKRVIIYPSVKQIEELAFIGCSSLVEIDFRGTMEQWLAIDIDNRFDVETGEYIVRCTDGILTKDQAK